MMDTKANENYVNQYWDDSILPSLAEYVSIPNKSPMFDSAWESNGYRNDAVEHMVK